MTAPAPEPTDAELRAAWARIAAARLQRASDVSARLSLPDYEHAMADPLLRPIVHAAARSRGREPERVQTPAQASAAPASTAPAHPARVHHPPLPAAVDRKRMAAGDTDEADE